MLRADQQKGSWVARIPVSSSFLGFAKQDSSSCQQKHVPYPRPRFRQIPRSRRTCSWVLRKGLFVRAVPIARSKFARNESTQTPCQPSFCSVQRIASSANAGRPQNQERFFLHRSPTGSPRHGANVGVALGIETDRPTGRHGFRSLLAKGAGYFIGCVDCCYRSLPIEKFSHS